ncbi:hypothetical protein BaRGS_00017088 [Batillaria attramentaria]|uniref:HAT C-terminal dimerisation domain-containing protein n=1 Tax=Batillaria attramentaria TaxID=370345 RepID=A0ABD0KXU9_9CAEN
MPPKKRLKLGKLDKNQSVLTSVFQQTESSKETTSEEPTASSTALLRLQLSHLQFAEVPNAKAKQSTLSLSGFFTQAASQKQTVLGIERATTKVEAMICQLIAEMNMPLQMADTLTSAMKAVFPDSAIARGLKCGRSKATAMIKEMAAQAASGLQERMRSGPFTISTDGSNDAEVSPGVPCWVYPAHRAQCCKEGFNKSSDRKGRFQQMQAVFDVEHNKIIKHVPTRWLSISRCLQRLLENWDALKVFFNEEAESLKKKAASSPYAVSKVSIIYDFVRSPTNKLYLHFLLYSVAAFQEFLLVFQSEAPHIHKLKRGMEKLLNTILSHFVKPAARRGKSVLDNEFAKTDNIVSNADLGIGEEARNFIEDKGANHLRDSRISEFYTNHAEVADVSLQDSASQQSVRYFLKRFPCLLPPGADVNIILDQFAQYQGEGVMDQVAKREDQTWLNISKMPDKDYKALSLVMRGILTIPLGSVHCERVFSCVRKLKRPERSCLSEETLESILVLQSSSVGPVEAVNPMSDQQLDAIKLAYALSLKKKCLSLD